MRFFTLLVYAQVCTNILCWHTFKVGQAFTLFLADRMNVKSKIRIYKKIIEEACREYDCAKEFITNKIKELRSKERISTEEVRSYIFK